MIQANYRKWNISRVEWVLFLLLPLLVFPVFWILALVIDWFIGDAEIIMRLLYESRNVLLTEFLQDWIASLPSSAFIIWLLYFPTYLYLGSKGFGKINGTLLSGFLVGLILGAWLYRLNILGIIIVGMSGIFLSFCLLFLSGILHRWK
jgi:hypothetical protein